MASTYRPDPDRIVEYVQEQCGKCGRTDTAPGRTIRKVVLDLGECGRVIRYPEKATPAFCRHCSALTWPATESIPGTWAGPNLRRIIMNLHAVTPTVRGICYVLFTNHNVTLSEGAVSNCLSAMARHIRKGSLVEAIRGDDPASEPLPAASRPPVAALPDGDGDGRPNQPSRFDPGKVPLLNRMEEEASMSAYVEFDESRVNVAGSKEMALVLLTSTLVITRIATNRAGDTIERLFWMVLDRPLVAGSYRGGNVFRGDYQTCFVHVWRKAESLAIEHGIDSPEQTYSQMLLDIYYAAKEAAAAVTEMAGGPADSACRIGLPTRVVPGLADLVASARARMADDLSKVVQAYRHMEVSHPETRKVRRHPGEGRPAYGHVHRPPRDARQHQQCREDHPRVHGPAAQHPADTARLGGRPHPGDAAERPRHLPHPGDILRRCSSGEARLLGVRVGQAAAGPRAPLNGPTDARGRTARAVTAYAAL